MFEITILSDQSSWINHYIPTLIQHLKQRSHQVNWVYQATEIKPGDFVFCLGCGQILSADILRNNRHNLVIHESKLPQGKGWSPLTWQILEGYNDIPITLFEASKKVDSGTIYLSDRMIFKGTELVDELRQVQAETSIQICLTFVDRYPEVLEQGILPTGVSSFYRRRTQKDSQLDVDQSIREQFNLLRVADNDRYPAFFELHGEIYFIKIEKLRK